MNLSKTSQCTLRNYCSIGPERVLVSVEDWATKQARDWMGTGRQDCVEDHDVILVSGLFLGLLHLLFLIRVLVASPLINTAAYIGHSDCYFRVY